MYRRVHQGSWVLLVLLGSGLLLGVSACVVVKEAEAPSAYDENADFRTAPVPDPPPATLVIFQPANEALSQQQQSEIGKTSPSYVSSATTERIPTEVFPGPTMDSPTLSPGSDYYISGFACTGSMRPMLDCGDEAEFLRPPFPRSLDVGDVISFLPDISCRYYKFQEISKAHRIIDIRVENGVSYYTTKGDSSSNPDPCEITLEQIDGLLVAVRKGVRPQDIIDTSEYELAKKRVQDLKQEYARLTGLYDERKSRYDGMVLEYQALVSDYQEGKSSYQAVAEFYRELEEERTALNALRDELNALTDVINGSIDDVDRIYQELFAN